MGGCRTTLVASFYKTATTTKEAEKIAKTEFGVNADYSNATVEMANYMNKGLLTARSNQMPMPQRIMTDSKLAQEKFQKFAPDTPASFLEPANSPYKETTILINEKSNYWKNIKQNSKEDGTKINGISLASTENELHVMLHEIAHNEHFNRNQPYYRKRAVFEDKELIHFISKNVSQRASYDSREFVAEVRIGLINGKKYNEETMKMYRDFGGIE